MANDAHTHEGGAMSTTTVALSGAALSNTPTPEALAAWGWRGSPARPRGAVSASASGGQGCTSAPLQQRRPAAQARAGGGEA
jgi:hypothetical protein